MKFDNRYIIAHAISVSFFVAIVGYAAVVRVREIYAYNDSGHDRHNPDTLKFATVNYSLQILNTFVLVIVQGSILI